MWGVLQTASHKAAAALIPVKNFLFGRAVIAGQLSSCPPVGSRMGWNSFWNLLTEEDKGGRRGKSRGSRICSESLVSHF